MCAYELIKWNMKTSSSSDDNLLRGEMLDVSSWKPQRASLFINHNPLPWKPSAIRFQADPSIIKTNSKEPWNKIYWCMSELELEWLSRAFHAADCVPLLPAGRVREARKSGCVGGGRVLLLSWMKVKSLCGEKWLDVLGGAGWASSTVAGWKKGWVNGLRRWADSASRLRRWWEVRVMMVCVWKGGGGYILVSLDVWTGPIASIWRRHSSWGGLDETGVSLGFEEGS